MSPALKKAIQKEMLTESLKFCKDRGIKIDRESVAEMVENSVGTFLGGASVDMLMLHMDEFIDNMMQSNLSDEEWPSEPALSPPTA